MKAIVRMLWGALRPVVHVWLVTRALVLPAEKLGYWAQRLGCSVEELKAYNMWLAEQAAARVDEAKPSGAPDRGA